jgi:NhaA family Na+:H+ antiporter
MASTEPSGHGPLPSTPPEAWEPLLRLSRLASRPLERFLRIEAASGILLLVCAAIALVWASSPWASSYAALWHTPLGVRVGSFVFERSLEWVVNDALMVVFFFVVGMEIRRELHHGELSEWRRAALPAMAALGGVLAPAALYLALAGAPATRSGWGVPMATDIAFAVGILTLLGKRVPAALRVLLLALAVIDDLMARGCHSRASRWPRRAWAPCSPCSASACARSSPTWCPRSWRGAASTRPASTRPSRA